MRSFGDTRESDSQTMGFQSCAAGPRWETDAANGSYNMHQVILKVDTLPSILNRMFNGRGTFECRSVSDTVSHSRK